MKLTMFAAGQNTLPATHTSAQVSTNFRTPPSAPFPSSAPIHTLNRNAYDGNKNTCPSATFLAAARGHRAGPTTRSITPKVLLSSRVTRGVRSVRDGIWASVSGARSGVSPALSLASATNVRVETIESSRKQKTRWL